MDNSGSVCCIPSIETNKTNCKVHVRDCLAYKQFCKVHLTCCKTVLYGTANKEPHSQHPAFIVTATMCSCCLQHEHLLLLTYTFQNLYYTFIYVVSYTLSFALAVVQISTC